MALYFPCGELKDGYHSIVSPQNAALNWLEFGRLRVTPGQPHVSESGQHEVMLVVLSGSGRVDVEGAGQAPSTYRMSRRDVFVDKATLVYIPAQHRLTVVSDMGVFDVGVFKAPADRPGRPFLISPDEIEHRSVGVANWRRDVYLATQPQMPIERLIVGETITPPGHWSSYPPHKHDVVSSEGERPYEEVFFYLVKPCHGYGLQQLYDSPDRKPRLDDVYVVRDGDVLAIPHGYHPAVAGAGYGLYYLWALAGQAREYGTWTDDPAHSWLRRCEPIISERER